MRWLSVADFTRPDARIGMHLLFYGPLERKLVRTGAVEALLREQSVKEGTVYNSPSSVSSISSFITTYGIPIEELLIQDIKNGYKCFNEFFYRSQTPFPVSEISS